MATHQDLDGRNLDEFICPCTDSYTFRVLDFCVEYADMYTRRVDSVELTIYCKTCKESTGWEWNGDECDEWNGMMIKCHNNCDRWTMAEGTITPLLRPIAKTGEEERVRGMARRRQEIEEGGKSRESAVSGVEGIVAEKCGLCGACGTPLLEGGVREGTGLSEWQVVKIGHEHIPVCINCYKRTVGTK